MCVCTLSLCITHINILHNKYNQWFLTNEKWTKSKPTSYCSHFQSKSWYKAWKLLSPLCLCYNDTKHNMYTLSHIHTHTQYENIINMKYRSKSRKIQMKERKKTSSIKHYYILSTKGNNSTKVLKESDRAIIEWKSERNEQKKTEPLWINTINIKGKKKRKANNQ